MLERAIARACDDDVVTQEALRRLSPSSCDDSVSPSTERPRSTDSPRPSTSSRCGGTPRGRWRHASAASERIGPWSVGVVALEGLGRYDHGIVGDLSLVKLHSALTGRWVDGHETAALLAPYGSGRGSPARSCFSAGRAGSFPAHPPTSRGSRAAARVGRHRLDAMTIDSGRIAVLGRGASARP